MVEVVEVGGGGAGGAEGGWWRWWRFFVVMVEVGGDGWRRWRGWRLVVVVVWCWMKSVRMMVDVSVILHLCVIAVIIRSVSHNLIMNVFSLSRGPAGCQSQCSAVQ